MDANCQGQDGDAANGEMIRKTANEKEKEKERAMHDAGIEGRRKRMLDYLNTVTTYTSLTND